VFVDFTAAWCVTCQYNKRTTLNDEQLLAEFDARRVLLLRADWTRQDARSPGTGAARPQRRRSMRSLAGWYKSGAAALLSEILSVAEVREAIREGLRKRSPARGSERAQHT
jgi:thiol:disulfide interchange protein DsbD